jgi:hypothetical protein
MSSLARLPIVRHLRWLYLRYRVEQHYARWWSLGYFPVHRKLDDEQLDRIWRGDA